MSDKPELFHLSEQGSSSLVRSPARSGIAARGRKDAAALAARRAEVEYRAIVTIRKGEWHEFLPKFFGVVDRSGEFVVDPIYRAIDRFSGGLAAFSPSTVERRSYGMLLDSLFSADLGLWGYLDYNGQIVIDPSFERARCFSEDLAAAAINGKWGFIRKDGSWAIRPQFDGALSFEDGLACVRVGQKCGFVDKTGDIVIGPRFDLLFAFSEGLACAELDGNLGYIGRDGVFAIEPRFDSFENGSASSFRFGVARAELNGKPCLINQTGNLIFQCEDGSSIEDFREGIAIVHEAGGNQEHGYYIDQDGRRILQEATDDSDDLDADSLDAVEGFGEGLGVVAASFVDFDHGSFALRRHAGRPGSRRVHGYVDVHGQMAIFPQFASAKPFREGLAAVDVDGSGKYGFINKSGELSIETRFAKVLDFSNGVARVGQRSGREGRWGFIDRSGNMNIDCQYDWAEDFQGIAI